MKDTTTQTAPTFAAVNDPLVQDFKSATFVVSLFINLTLFVTWVTFQIMA